MLYIKRDINEHYIQSDIAIETLGGYENSVGTTWEDYLSGKFILLSQSQIDFMEVNPGASPKEVFNMTVIEPEIPEETIEDVRNMVRNQIMDYDLSENVNIFFVNGDPIWLDKDTRAGLKLRFEAESILGDTSTTLWYGTTRYTLELQHATQMLYAIEKYASMCYDNTQSHLAEIENINDIDVLREYDYTSGYPDKLYF